jgi:hypothetical protein
MSWYAPVFCKKSMQIRAVMPIFVEISHQLLSVEAMAIQA